jgi:NTP-dependent ternary system trypsin peptidase co-occuring protein
MKALEATADDGTTLLVEVDVEAIEVISATAPGGTLASAGGAKVVERLEDLGKSIGAACQTIYTHARNSLEAHTPDEFSLEFGVKLAGEAGLWVLTKASAEGSVKVTAKWTREKEA